MKAPYRIVSEIFEEGTDYPVVTHIFRGTTPEKARAFFKAHLTTDSFFKDCVQKKRFRTFTCYEKRRLEHWTMGSWEVIG